MLLSSDRVSVQVSREAQTCTNDTRSSTVSLQRHAGDCSRPPTPCLLEWTDQNRRDTLLSGTETPRAAQGRPLHPWPPPGALRLKECACALSCQPAFSLAVLVQGPSTAAKNAVCFQDEHAAPSLFDRQTRLKNTGGAKPGVLAERCRTGQAAQSGP